MGTWDVLPHDYCKRPTGYRVNCRRAFRLRQVRDGEYTSNVLVYRKIKRLSQVKGTARTSLVGQALASAQENGLAGEGQDRIISQAFATLYGGMY